MFVGANGPDANPAIQLVDSYTGRGLGYQLAEFNESVGSVDYFLFR